MTPSDPESETDGGTFDDDITKADVSGNLTDDDDSGEDVEARERAT